MEQNPTIDSLGLSVRSRRLLSLLNITTMDALLSTPVCQLMRQRSYGKVTAREILGKVGCGADLPLWSDMTVGEALAGRPVSISAPGVSTEQVKRELDEAKLRVKYLEGLLRLRCNDGERLRRIDP